MEGNSNSSLKNPTLKFEAGKDSLDGENKSSKKIVRFRAGVLKCRQTQVSEIKWLFDVYHHNIL
jgi:hypothetical protein